MLSVCQILFQIFLCLSLDVLNILFAHSRPCNGHYSEDFRQPFHNDVHFILVCHLNVNSCLSKSDICFGNIFQRIFDVSHEYAFEFWTISAL